MYPETVGDLKSFLIANDIPDDTPVRFMGLYEEMTPEMFVFLDGGVVYFQEADL